MVFHRFNCEQGDSRGCNLICETPIAEVSLTVLKTFKEFVYSFTKLIVVIMNRRTPEKSLTLK